MPFQSGLLINQKLIISVPVEDDGVREWPTAMPDDIEFWPLQRVVQITGLSRSEIYRRQKESSFPRARPYKNSSRVFWVSSDVREWMRGQLADVSVDGLIG
jgi:predicted DNA-binding transcriptional regulator AlpA